jgi:ferredoxin
VRARVDPSRCRGHALCFATAPTIFHWDAEHDRAVSDDAIVPPELEQDVVAACDGCPERAISIEP